MKPNPKTGLTMMDIAILADGLGNIRDETAERLAPLVREDPRYANELAELRQMAQDADARCLADALDTHRRLCRLRKERWTKPLDVLDPALDVPYAELITLARSWERRATGEERAELRRLLERLVEAFGDDLMEDRHFKLWMERLLDVEQPVAEATLEHLMAHYRSCREETGARQRTTPLKTGQEA